MPSSSSRNDINFGSMVAAATLGAVCMWAYSDWTSKKKHRIPSELRSSPYVREIELAVRLALKTGKNISNYCSVKGTEAESSFDLGVDFKSQPTDFCTNIDVLNEEIITKAIRDSFPSYQIIGEESVGTGKIPPLTAQPTFVIDPIDGTTNFSVGFPMACVSIGFCLDKKPVMGVVYAPMTDELYMAVTGFGAYRNGVKLTKRQNLPLQQAVIEFEFGYPRSEEAVSKMVGAVQKFMSAKCLATRQIGSGVLDLCYVATGRFSAVYSGLAGEGWKPWDHCAGMVIALEAGCSIESFNQPPGEAFDIYSDSIICAVSQPLLEECRKILKS